MQQYNDLVRRVLRQRKRSVDSSGRKYASIFGDQIRFDLNNGFPYSIHWPASIIAAARDVEALLRGEGEGGYLWRSFGGNRPFNNGVDQIERLMREIKTNPNSRRLLVTGWDPEYAEDAETPHSILFQFKIVELKTLHCQLYVRSADVYKDVPHIITAAALLLWLIAVVNDLEVGELIVSFGDLHLYDDERKRVISVIRKKFLGNPSFMFRDRFCIGIPNLFYVPPRDAIQKPKGIEGLMQYRAEEVFCTGPTNGQYRRGKKRIRYR